MAVIHLIHQLFLKKINAQDLVLKKNAGFLSDDSAIFIDIGQFSEGKASSAEGIKRGMEVCTFRLREWLKEYAPEYLSFFDQKIQEKLTVLTQTHSLSFLPDPAMPGRFFRS